MLKEFVCRNPTAAARAVTGRVCDVWKMWCDKDRKTMEKYKQLSILFNTADNDTLSKGIKKYRAEIRHCYWGSAHLRF